MMMDAFDTQCTLTNARLCQEANVPRLCETLPVLLTGSITHKQAQRIIKKKMAGIAACVEY